MQILLLLKAADYKKTSYMIRHNKIIANNENNIMLSLNRYGFFNSFENQICPNGKVTLNITLESSNNLIYRDGGDAGRVIITRMKLWVPKMIFNPEGQQLFLTKYLKPHTWSFLKENLLESPEYQTRSGTFNISSAISRPRHVFIFAINIPIGLKIRSRTRFYSILTILQIIELFKVAN